MTRELPTGWNWKELRNLFEVEKKQIDSTSPLFASLNFIGMENIESATRIFIPNGSSEMTGESSCFLFDQTHVLYGKLRPYLNKIYLPENKGRCSMELLPLRPQEGYSREFIAAVLQLPAVTAYAVKHSTGGRMPRANMEKLLSLEVPIPLDVTKRNYIADEVQKSLTEIESMRQAALKQKQAADASYSAILRDELLFTDKSKLPIGWKFTQILQVVAKMKGAIKRGPFGSAITKDCFVPSGYKVYEQKNAIYNDFRIGNYFIDEDKFEELSGFELKPGDVIISCSGTIGKIAIAPQGLQRGIINQALLRITLNDKIIHTRYFVHVFDLIVSLLMQNDSRGAAIKNLSSVETIKKSTIPLPPTINEQIAIANRIDEKLHGIGSLNRAADTQLEAINAMPSAILREVFDFEKN